MNIISGILRSFGAGAIGGAANVLLLLYFWHLQIIPGPELTPDFIKMFLYKQMVWGGIWGFAFLIPIMTRHWILRGLVWGVAATAVALYVFKVAPVSVLSIVIGLAVNSGAWGLVASGLYYKSSPAKQATP